MTTKKESHPLINTAQIVLLGLLGLTIAAGIYFIAPKLSAVSYVAGVLASATSTPTVPQLDKTGYDTKLLFLAHVATSSQWYTAFLAGATSTTIGTSTNAKIIKPLWPVRAAYPADSRALLPANRIVAYYGNFYSKGMGVLGEYDEATVLTKLQAQVAVWQAADPTTPVVPAIEYIDVTAQGSPGKDGKYRLRMPDSQIDKAIEMAAKINGIVILDVQVGLSTVPAELPLIEKYLAMPNVHLALDPEFAMHNGTPPGRAIGSMSADDINWAAHYLANLVQQNNLPPKILVVHRFTEDMVTNYKKIEPLPEVQIVMQMDGWGGPARKVNTYNTVIYPEPVEFTGFKLFYKNDLKEIPPRLMTPSEVLKLTPSPIFIQYQ